MITLVIKPYCEKCPMFDPETIKNNMANMTEVVCKYRSMCSTIYKYAKREKIKEAAK